MDNRSPGSYTFLRALPTHTYSPRKSAEARKDAWRPQLYVKWKLEPDLEMSRLDAPGGSKENVCRECSRGPLSSLMVGLPTYDLTFRWGTAVSGEGLEGNAADTSLDCNAKILRIF